MTAALGEIPAASTTSLRSRVGFEVELVTPRDCTREDLANDIAAGVGGSVRAIWHRDSEPSAVPGMGAFRHLTRGFDVVDADGEHVCKVVDDVTIVADLDVRAAPLPGWLRIVTDDPRLLTLLARTCDPTAPIEDVLTPVGRLFGTGTTGSDSGIRKVVDPEGGTVAMAAPLPGERHRPAEIITSPLVADHGAALDRLLRPARDLGCRVPVEAAVHMHLDAQPFRSPRALANLVELFSAWRDALWALLGTNRNCRRLAAPPQPLVDQVPLLRRMSTWDEALTAAKAANVTKYSDLNLVHLLTAPTVKDTLEVRVLPGSVDTDEIMSLAAMVESLLDRCREDPWLPRPSGSLARDADTLRALAAGR
jgi:hypothetical protein